MFLLLRSLRLAFSDNAGQMRDDPQDGSVELRDFRCTGMVGSGPKLHLKFVQHPEVTDCRYLVCPDGSRAMIFLGIYHKDGELEFMPGLKQMLLAKEFSFLFS